MQPTGSTTAHCPARITAQQGFIVLKYTRSVVSIKMCLQRGDKRSSVCFGFFNDMTDIQIYASFHSEAHIMNTDDGPIFETQKETSQSAS